MRNYILFAFFLLTTLHSHSQWAIMNGLMQGGISRFDDITFVNDSIAYAAQGISSLTYRSTDGGNNWSLSHTGNHYKRSIEFIDYIRARVVLEGSKKIFKMLLRKKIILVLVFQHLY